MRLTRILGLAVATALLAMVAGGAAVASAEVTVLCKANEEKCSEENTYELSTEIEGKLELGTTLSFTSLAFSVQCAASEGMKIYPEEETAEALLGLLGGLYFIQCKAAGKDCANEIWELPWQAEFHSTPTKGGRKEWVNFSGGENGIPTIKIECFIAPKTTFKCLFAAETLEMEVQGGEPARLLTNGATLSLVAGLESQCGKTLAWNATYVLSPEPLFVTKS